ncbi:MAG TPA: hypothetical protein VMU89_12060 [Thermomicrobiaceae bacterium]|nr:hypothetical protein [Thermomicrobiaceae bacterium]
MTVETYPYRELLADVISPVAVSVLERMAPVIVQIYDLDQLLDAPMPTGERGTHAELFTERLRRIVRLLPPNVSPMPNEVFTAIEFLIYQVHGEPVLIGQAIARLEVLSEEIKADPLLHSLVTGRAN